MAPPPWLSPLVVALPALRITAGGGQHHPGRGTGPARGRRRAAERLVITTSAVVGTIVLATAAAGLEAEPDAPHGNIHTFADAPW
jgi:hypothetical protein